jgi:hypothetical protein
MNVKPSVGKNDLANYEEWMKEFGEQGTNWLSSLWHSQLQI